MPPVARAGMANSSLADQLSALGVVGEPQRTNAGKAASASSNKKRKAKGAVVPFVWTATGLE